MMYRTISTIIGLFTLILHTYSQEVVQQPKLKVFIDSLYQIDQQVQQNMIDAFQNGLPFDSIKALESVEMQTFARHIPILKNIYKKFGYPSRQVVGEESAANFFTLIQHADADVAFQAQMLPVIKNEVDKKQLNGEKYAFLYDRVHLNKGGKQLYGTQLDYDNNDNAFAKNLKNKKTVNKRRKQLGMENPGRLFSQGDCQAQANESTELIIKNCQSCTGCVSCRYGQGKRIKNLKKEPQTAKCKTAKCKRKTEKY